MNLKAFVGLLICTLFYTAVPAQVFQFPAIKKEANAIADFIPPGWDLVDSASGDLNGDKLRDIVLGIQCRDSVTDSAGSKQIIAHRILAVVFKVANRYSLKLQNNTFLVRENLGPWLPSPFGKLSIEKGILNIYYEFIRGGVNYKFRYQSNSFCLIGASSNYVAAGVLEAWDFNFLTKKAVRTSGAIDAVKLKAEKRDIPQNRLKKLDEMKQPLDGQISPEAGI